MAADAVAIMRRTWGEIAVPAAHLVAAAHAGGTLLVAYDGDDPVGCCYGFVGLDDGSLWPLAATPGARHRPPGAQRLQRPSPTKQQPVLWSHMLAVVPHARRRGLGARLKQEQAALARQRGLSRVLWTFDPLEGGNARLNLHRLGAVAGIYDVNRYGPLDDPLNAGLETDRLVADWWVGPDAGRPWPGRTSAAPPVRHIDVALGDWRADPQAARRAREAARAAFLAAFDERLLAVDVRVEGDRARYVLVDPEAADA